MIRIYADLLAKIIKNDLKKKDSYFLIDYHTKNIKNVTVNLINVCKRYVINLYIDLDR